MENTMLFQVLDALFSLAMDSEPTTPQSIAERLGQQMRSEDLWSTLLHLESRGLVRARTMRLTMRGLSAAVALRARAHRDSDRAQAA